MLVSVNVEDLRRVVQLACVTEDRDNDEHRALLVVAAKLDRALNACTGLNTAMWGLHAGTQRALRQRPLSRLLEEARSTRGEPAPDLGQRAVDLPEAQLRQYERKMAEWEALPSQVP